jgi:hypothetical protein
MCQTSKGASELHGCEKVRRPEVEALRDERGDAERELHESSRNGEMTKAADVVVIEQMKLDQKFTMKSWGCSETTL